MRFVKERKKRWEEKELTQHFLEFEAQSWKRKSPPSRTDGASADKASALCTSSRVFVPRTLSARRFMHRHTDFS